MFRILLSFGLRRSVLAAWGCLAIAGATLPVTGGSIVWEAPQPISDIEVDVSTNGVMAYAYFCYFNYWATLYPRGQRFTTWYTNRYTDKPRFDNDVEMLTGWYGRNSMSEGLTNLLSGVVSSRETYKRMLSCSADSQYRGQPITLRLKNLQPGSRYEVQLWSNANNKTNDCDAPMLLDDGETHLATYTPLPGGTNGPGEHVKGTFTATNTFYDLRLTPETNKLAVLNMFQVRLLSPVAPVTWEPPADITDENDIRTDGKPVFAWGFTGTNYTLKGTTFNSQNSHLTFFPRGNFSVAQNDAPYFTDFMVSPTNGSISCHPKFFESAQTSSSDYFRMIAGGLYLNKESVALLFGNLIQGHTYLIQLWVGDGRAAAPTSGWSYRTVSIDGSAPLQYGGGPNQLGQYIVGTFVARGDKRQLMMDVGIMPDPPVKPSVACWQLNAIQVRDLTPDLVSWEPVRVVTGDPETDVDASGTSFYAWHGGTNDVTYGGVTFRARHPFGRDPGRLAPDAERDISYVQPCCEIITNMTAQIVENNGWPAETSDTLREMLDWASYCGRGSAREILLRRLLPGQRYRVQFFFTDARTNCFVRHHLLLDGVARVPVVTNKLAYCVSGEFTATAPERSVLLRSIGYCVSPFVQAIQVRALTPGGTKEALETGVILLGRQEEDVRTEGTLVEALCGENEIAPNGVPFRHPKDTAWSDTTNISLPGNFRFYSRVTSTWYGGSTDYNRLLGGGYYAADNSNITSLTLSLGNLTPGHRYRVQLWQCDRRTDYYGRWRYSEIDNYGGSYYWGYTGQGFYALIDFTAFSESRPLTIKSPWVQVNAIQLRDLGEFNAYETWSGTKSLAEDTVLTGDVLAEDGLEVTGPGKLSGTGNFLRGNCTLNAVWDGETISRVDTGRTTLAVAPSRAQTFVVTGEGSIQLAEGVTAAATYVRGNGTFAGPGTLDYALTGDAAFDGCLAENLVVRKTGRGTWRLSGAQAGTARVEAPEGGLALASGIFTGEWTLAPSKKVVVSGVNFGSGSALRLAEATSLAVKGPATLDNMTLRVADPHNYLQRKAHPIVVYGPEATGAPQVVLEKAGFVLASETRADGSIALYALARRGLVLSIR